ncbi:hypothetical protein P875_00021483 [Aspergillus parasiticus SU-1]|uniref:Uncharacterized protein n=1 Tax=Aspergillus parasiticus (strain ATCC 56775 / NRRL 5862 / SRRC 143 / SU-1) TaxID=1403190 RepID=A0A0F0IF79_ASPPU|nr:hypothetical protein P875_00021483 [Aspergillus parasiticus SU-1]
MPRGEISNARFVPQKNMGVNHISALLSGCRWFVGVPANRPMQLRPTDLLRSGTIGEHRLVYDESTRPANAKLNQNVQ